MTQSNDFAYRSTFKSWSKNYTFSSKSVICTYLCHSFSFTDRLLLSVTTQRGGALRREIMQHPPNLCIYLLVINTDNN